MTTTVTIEEAQSRLAELLGSLSAGDHIVITANNLPIAEVRPPAERPHPQPGACAGMVIEYIDDDEHLKDWAEYMP